MNQNIKAGDLALVVGAFRITENIGKTVRVEEFLTEGQVSLWADEEGRPARNDCGGGGWLVSASGLESGCKGRKGFALINPKHLMPLRGDRSPTRQKAQQVPA